VVLSLRDLIISSCFPWTSVPGYRIRSRRDPSRRNLEHNFPHFSAIYLPRLMNKPQPADKGFEPGFWLAV